MPQFKLDKNALPKDVRDRIDFDLANLEALLNPKATAGERENARYSMRGLREVLDIYHSMGVPGALTREEFDAAEKAPRNWSEEDKADARHLIKRAEKKLGPLDEGQKADLLLDRFDWLRSSEDAHSLLAAIK